jgi:cytochrome b561
MTTRSSSVRPTEAAAAARYSGPAIVLHWLLALALFGIFALGVYMADLPISPERLRLFNWHKWAGITILALSLLRLGWRLTHAPPPDLPMPAWQRRLAHLSHRTMYALFLVVPLVGWAYSSATGFQVVVFGVLPLPDFVPKSKPLAEVLETAHATLAWLLAGLVMVHVAASIKHALVDRDGLLRRMWFAPRVRPDARTSRAQPEGRAPRVPPEARASRARADSRAALRDRPRRA